MRFLLSMIMLAAMAAHAAEKEGCACEKAPNRFGAKIPPSVRQGMSAIPAGTYQMGGDNHQARRDEMPKHQVSVSAFWLDSTPVTNEQFRQFVQATHYKTTAEIKPDWELLKKQLPAGTPKPGASKLVPASLVFTPPKHRVPLTDMNQWWAWTPGANWRHPHGAKSNLQGLNLHPVVHVSWDDAKAYCQWRSKRLPTEAEWEWAARGGLTNKLYPWGDEPVEIGKLKANTWHGEFPYHNNLVDKCYYTSPVKTYPANGYGLYDMAGNVWEWVNDWYHADYYAKVSKQPLTNPEGAATSYDPAEPYATKRVLRGGSFLCNEAYCSGYRVSARMKSTPDTSMEHVGFRCALS